MKLREKVDSNNEDKDKKNWQNDFDFRIIYIKFRLSDNHGNFHENMKKKKFDLFLRHF